MSNQFAWQAELNPQEHQEAACSALADYADALIGVRDARERWQRVAGWTTDTATGSGPDPRPAAQSHLDEQLGQLDEAERRLQRLGTDMARLRQEARLREAGHPRPHGPLGGMTLGETTPVPVPDIEPVARDPVPSGQVIGEVSTHSLDPAEPLSAETVRGRVDGAAPGLPSELRAVIAAKIAEALGHRRHGTGHQGEEAYEHWDEVLQRGLFVGESDELVRVSFRPATAPSPDALTPLVPGGKGTASGTSVFSTVSYSDSVVQQKNIGAGVMLDFFTGAVGHASFLSPGFTFVPRKQLIQESLRRTESVGGSRLADGPRGTYTAGTVVVITRLGGPHDGQSFHADLHEHAVTYAVRTSVAPPQAVPSATGAEPPTATAAPLSITVTAPARLSRYPFALVSLDAEPVLAEIGRRLLAAGYSGEEAGEALDTIAGEVFNPELAKRFNQSLLDGTYRSGLVEVGYLPGNIRISLELAALVRNADITGADAVPLRTDFADSMFTEENRAHGYDAPLELEVLARLFGLKVGGGGIGLETTTMYESSVEEAHARKFAASFGGDLARYQATVRAVVEFDTDDWAFKAGRLVHLANPLVRRGRMGSFTVGGIAGEIVVPAMHADAFERDVTQPIPDFGTAADTVIGLYRTPGAELPASGPRPGDGVRLADQRPLASRRPRPPVLDRAIGAGEEFRFTRGQRPTTLPPVSGLPWASLADRMRMVARALLQQAAYGGVQVVVEDPDLAAALRGEVQRVWPGDSGADIPRALVNAIGNLAAAEDPLAPGTLSPYDLLALLLTHPDVRIVDADGVLVASHSPYTPMARQYVIDHRGRVFRSVRSTLEDGVYEDDLMTAVPSLQAAGTTLQLASGRGLGAAAVPLAPGLADVLRQVERAMAVLMDAHGAVRKLPTLAPQQERLARYQNARVRTELMNRLSAYFSTARLRSGFDTLLRHGFKISFWVSGRHLWQPARRFEILVRADLLDRLDGGVSATDQDVAVDLQVQGDLQTANVIEQENAFMLEGDAELELGFHRVARFNVAELYLELEVGTVSARDLTTKRSTFSRLSAPPGEASRPEYRVRYAINIAEFNRAGERVGRWSHQVNGTVAPVVPRAFQPGLVAVEGPGTLDLRDYLRGLDEFWELPGDSFGRLKEQSLRFDLVGATGVTLRLANLERLVGRAMGLVAAHNAAHGIRLSADELAEVEARARDVFDESYFGAHLPRLAGFNGMPVELPWLRRMMPRPANFHRAQVPDIKSSFDIKLILVPTASGASAAAAGATMMARRHHLTDAQQNRGHYVNLFGSLILGPQFRLGHLGADNPASEVYDAIAPQVEVRGEVEGFREQHTATGGDAFTMLEYPRDGVSVGAYSAAVQITFSTRFSKQEPVSSTRSFFLGDGTAQLEMPVSLAASLAAADPLAGWAPVPDGTPGRRVALSNGLAYAAAHVAAVAPGDEVAALGGIARWIIGTLQRDGLVDARFLSSTDLNTQKLIAAFDENALAGDLSTLTTLGIAEHLNIPQLGEKRLTVVLKGTSATGGPRYVGSSAGLRAATGTRAVNEEGKFSERVGAGGIGPNVEFSAAMNERTEAMATPSIAYRYDVGRVVGEETLTVEENLRRLSGPEPDGRSPDTDDFRDELTLTMEVYTDWVPAEPVRFLTSGGKSVLDRLATLIAAKPVGARERKPGSLNDPDGFRTPIKAYRLPGTARALMTMDRALTQDASAYRHPRPPAAVPGFRTEIAEPTPSPLNRALAPVFYGILPGDVVNVDRHVRYAGQHWNIPNALWRLLAPEQLAAHLPTKESSYSRSGNKGRQAAQALSPGVLRGNMHLVLTLRYSIIARGASPGGGTAQGISYGMQLTGIGRPLPREIRGNANPMTGLTVRARETEEETSFARDTAHQAWVDPLFGGAIAEGQPAVPHVNAVRTVEPASSVGQHGEINHRHQGSFVGYEFTGQDIVHSRGVNFVLNAPGSVTGFLRYEDAVRLAREFPDQVVHPDAVPVADRQRMAALHESLRRAGPSTASRGPVRLLAEPDEADGAIAVADRLARDGHTVQVIRITGAALEVRVVAPPARSPEEPASLTANFGPVPRGAPGTSTRTEVTEKAEVTGKGKERLRPAAETGGRPDVTELSRALEDRIAQTVGADALAGAEPPLENDPVDLFTVGLQAAQSAARHLGHSIRVVAIPGLPAINICP
jgi:hypothetical protein